MRTTLKAHVESKGGIGNIVNDALTSSQLSQRRQTILEEYHIYTKKEWKNFLRVFHPDKIGIECEEDGIIPEDVVMIIEEGKKRNW